MENNTTFTVYTRKLAYELRLQGFDIVGIVPDRSKPYYDNYLFLNTPSFQKAFAELTAKIGK